MVTGAAIRDEIQGPVSEPLDQFVKRKEVGGTSAHRDVLGALGDPEHSNTGPGREASAAAP